jgi:ribosomal protein S17E
MENKDLPPKTSIDTYPVALELLRDIEKVTGLDSANAISIALFDFLADNFKIEKDLESNKRYFQILVNRYNTKFNRHFSTDNELVSIYETGEVVGIVKDKAILIDRWRVNENEEYDEFKKLHQDLVYWNNKVITNKE